MAVPLASSEAVASVMGDAAKDYVAGFAAGVATVFIGHPFDTVKVKLQTQNTEVNTLKYRNAAHCIIHILKSEGVKGFYKGATSSFVGNALESSLLFGAYSQMRRVLQGEDVSEPELSSIVPAAAVGGACISMVLCPTELVKCRLQVQEGCTATVAKCVQRYNGPLDCVCKTVRNDGLQGLFRGGSSTFLRECVGNSFFFMTYELCRYRLLSPSKLHKDSMIQQYQGDQMQKYESGKNHSNAAIEGVVDIVCGGLAGVMFWAVVLPFDVVKTRIQTALDPRSSRNPFHNLKLIYGELGVKGLYAGLGPTLTRAFPANAAAMLTWELTAKLLGARRYDR